MPTAPRTFFPADQQHLKIEHLAHRASLLDAITISITINLPPLGIMSWHFHIDRHNENPKPFIWTAKANDILEKVKRARKALNNAHSV